MVQPLQRNLQTGYFTNGCVEDMDLPSLSATGITRSDIMRTSITLMN